MFTVLKVEEYTDYNSDLFCYNLGSSDRIKNNSYIE